MLAVKLAAERQDIQSQQVFTWTVKNSAGFKATEKSGLIFEGTHCNKMYSNPLTRISAAHH